jgi:hypothetical protein
MIFLITPMGVITMSLITAAKGQNGMRALHIHCNLFVCVCACGAGN